MAPPRHLARHAHKTLADTVTAILELKGWINQPINFGALPVQVQEVEPPRPEQVEPNVVAVSLDIPSNDEEAELGGGLMRRTYMLYIDVLGENWSTTMAIAEDIADGLRGARIALHDYIADDDTVHTIHLDDLDIDEPPAAGQVDRSTWRVVVGPADVYYTEQP